MLLYLGIKEVVLSINSLKEIQMSNANVAVKKAMSSQTVAETRRIVVGITLIVAVITAVVVWGPVVASIFPLPVD